MAHAAKPVSLEAPMAIGPWHSLGLLLEHTSGVRSPQISSEGQTITLTFSGLQREQALFQRHLLEYGYQRPFIPGTITVTTSDGGVEVLSIPTSPGSFIGYTSAVPIVSMVMSATSGATNNWIQVDHFYTGALVPEPGTMALLTLGVVGLAGAAIKRRRRS